MLKLYKIELKGAKAGILSKSCSPGTTYVIAPSMDSAHMALINAYGLSTSIDLKDIEIDTLEIIASEDTQINSPNFYKLVVFGNVVNSVDKKDETKDKKDKTNDEKSKSEKDTKTPKKRGRKPKTDKDLEEEENDNEQ